MRLRSLSVALVLVLPAAFPQKPTRNTSPQAQTPSITVSPAYVEAGSPELIRVAALPDATVRGHWLGHTLQFVTGHEEGTWYALAGVDVEAPAGSSILTVSIRSHNSSRELTSTITIHPAHYRTTAITVEPKFVEPGPEEQALIKTDSELKHEVFAVSDLGSSPPLWQGNFAAPVHSEATDSFGTRRTFNGKLASIHKGTDFHAATGTPVLAGNAGTVVLAQPLYYEGGCVMIDHGMGLMSISMHLSRIDVKPGDHVAIGQRVGLSGATGRATGPHLHWAIRWQGAYLDPVKVLHLDLGKIGRAR
jgi:hypothetical protein